MFSNKLFILSNTICFNCSSVTSFNVVLDNALVIESVFFQLVVVVFKLVALQGILKLPLFTSSKPLLL